jgi:hypothetical protein
MHGRVVKVMSLRKHSPVCVVAGHADSHAWEQRYFNVHPSVRLPHVVVSVVMHLQASDVLMLLVWRTHSKYSNLRHFGRVV